MTDRSKFEALFNRSPAVVNGGPDKTSSPYVRTSLLPWETELVRRLRPRDTHLYYAAVQAARAFAKIDKGVAPVSFRGIRHHGFFEVALNQGRQLRNEELEDEATPHPSKQKMLTTVPASFRFSKFAELDVDHDDQLSVDELSRPKFPGWPRQRMAILVKKYDMNGDGLLNPTEAAAAAWIELCGGVYRRWPRECAPYIAKPRQSSD